MGQPGNMLSPETFTTPRHTLNGQALFTIDRLSHPRSDGICLLLGLRLRQYNRA